MVQPKPTANPKPASSDPSPIMLNTLFKSKQKLKKKYKKDSDQLLSIYEQTGEDTASVESRFEEDDSDVINLAPKRKISKNACIVEDPPKRLESFDKLEYTYPRSTKEKVTRKNTLDELHDFVNNLMNFGSNRDIEITADKEANEISKNNEDNVFDIEYYGVNKTNNSLNSITHTIRNQKNNDCTLDIGSKRSVSDSNHPLTKRKESYSNAFLELLNSEIIEDSPKQRKNKQEVEKELNYSGFNLDILNQSNCNSGDFSSIMSSGKDMLLRKVDASRGDDRSDHVLKGINYFLKANKYKRKSSLKEPEIDRHKYDFTDQGQKLESEITDEELFKIS